MKAARYLNWRINREVNAEDTELINFVQEGMETSAYSSGPLAESEICLIDSAEKIRNSIPVSRLEVEPDADEIVKINEELLENKDKKVKNIFDKKKNLMNTQSQNKIYDTIVIGAGISGISAAYHLKKYSPKAEFFNS